MVKILTSLSLLIPAFSLLFRPHILSIMLHPMIESSPTTLRVSVESIASVYGLAPVIFGADSLD